MARADRREASPAALTAVAAGFELLQLAADEGLEPGAVVTLEGAQVVHLALEHSALGLQRPEDLALALLGFADEGLGAGASLGDDAVGLRTRLRHVLVCGALGEG